MTGARRDLEVARFATLPEGELAVTLLRDHGIDAYLPDRQMATSMPHLQTAIGGIRVVAPDDQIVEARDLIARARKGEFDALDAAEDDDDDTGGWKADHTPGRVGELEDHEVRGVLGSMKGAGRILIIGMLLLPLAGCLMLLAFGSSDGS